MFELKKRDTFTWPVTVYVPNDSGTFQKVDFRATFKLVEQSKMDRLVEQLKDDDSDLLKELLVGWDGIVDPVSKAPVDFSIESRDSLLDIPYVRSALIKTYFEAANGNKVKKGN